MKNCDVRLGGESPGAAKCVAISIVCDFYYYDAVNNGCAYDCCIYVSRGAFTFYVSLFFSYVLLLISF